MLGCREEERIMRRLSLDKWIRVIAGTFILISLVLAVKVNVKWLFFTAFVGINLIQSAFTDFCPMEILLLKLGVKKDKGNCGK